MRRFERLWSEWDAALARGRKAGEHLASLTNEQVLGLLATGSHRRDFERNLVLTEAMNRMSRARRVVDETTEAAEAALEDIGRAVESAPPATRHAESVAERHAVTAHGSPATPEVEAARAAALRTERVRDDVEARTEEIGERLQDLKRKAFPDEPRG